MRFFRRRRSDDGDNCSVTYGSKGHPTKVSVVARWDFDVVDPDKVIATVTSRLVGKGYDADDAAAHVRDVEQALIMLFELDGWEPKYESIGLEFAGSDATVRAISKTIEDGDDATDDGF